MKILILSLLISTSLYAQGRPASRKASKALEAVKNAASPCAALTGQDLNYCNKEWQEERKKLIKKFATIDLMDKAQEAVELEGQKIKDEKEMEKLRAWLLNHGVNTTAENTLAELRQMKADKQAELDTL